MKYYNQLVYMSVIFGLNLLIAFVTLLYNPMCWWSSSAAQSPYIYTNFDSTAKRFIAETLLYNLMCW